MSTIKETEKKSIKPSEKTRFDKVLELAIGEIGDWKYKDNIEKIYLYGSCARNEARYESDVDLYIELNEDVPAADIRELKIKCNPEDWRLPDVDIKTGVGAKIIENDDLFYRNIRGDGILLWKRK